MQILRRDGRVAVCLSLLLVFGIPANTLAQSATATRQASTTVQSKRWALDFDRLVKQKEYRELERQLRAAPLTAMERSYFEGILADRSNQVSQAIAILEKALPDLRTTSSHRAAVALRTLADDYFKCGRYADASDAYSDLVKHFTGEFSHAERQGIEDNLHTYQLLRDAVPQRVSGARNFSVTVRRNPLGDIDVPLQIGDAKQWWIFDTGANTSTITLSTAKRLGLTISKGSASTQSGATGAEVSLRTTVIPQINFGEAIVHNAVAVVMDDKTLNVNLGENGHYQIEGILGYPVMEALGSFTFSGNELVVSSESQPSSGSTRLYMEGLTPLMEATVGDHELLFGFDTGADSSSFTAKYLREFPHEFASLTSRKHKVGGAGGLRSMRAYYLPQVELNLGSATAALKNVPVLTRDLGVDPLDSVFGNLGLDLLNQFRTFTIDFRRMQLSVGEKAK
jgi:predicted aspartyl protease